MKPDLYVLCFDSTHIRVFYRDLQPLPPNRWLIVSALGSRTAVVKFETIMENIDEMHRQATDAISSRLWTTTVAIVNSIRTVGIDPVTKGPADGEEAGTGCAGRWRSHHFILTAGHVPHPDAKPSGLRIFWRPTGGVERIADADLKAHDIGDAVVIRDPEAVIHQCPWEDLAIIELSPAEAGPHTEFFDIETSWIDPAEGEIVHC